MKRKPTLFKRMQWMSERVAYGLFELFLSWWSLPALFKFGEVLGGGLYRLSPYSRGIVRRNLTMMLPSDQLDPTGPSAQQVKEVFMRNGGNMLTTLAAGGKSSKELNESLTLTGLESLESVLEESGAILVLAHMGNWEILTRCADWEKYHDRLGALYRPLNNPYMNDLVLQRRESAGMKLVSARNPIYTILKLLKRKGIMCILSDQKIGGKGAPASFFGRVTPCTRLPSMIHDRAEAPLFTVSMYATSPGKWQLDLQRVSGHTQQDIMDALSKSMQKSLPDCFLFQDRWQEFPRIFKDVEGSLILSKKPLPGIIESATIFAEYPELEKLIPSKEHPLLIWDEGASPEQAYFAIGSSPEFVKACRKVGLKKAIASPKDAVVRLRNK